jgi:hypothetical protein
MSEHACAIPAEEEKEGVPMHMHINTKIKPKKSTRKQENNFHKKKKKKTFETDQSLSGVQAEERGGWRWWLG